MPNCYRCGGFLANPATIPSDRPEDNWRYTNILIGAASSVDPLMKPVHEECPVKAANLPKSDNKERQMAVEPSADIMDQAACAAIRELLGMHGVPVAAFIDDHVANAIAQRNFLTDCLVALHPDLPTDKQAIVDDALAKAYPSGVDLTRIGDAAARHLQKSSSI